MKKISFLTPFLISAALSAQVAIGKTTLESSSSSIEFGDENRGVVLPWVTDTSSVQSAVNGTLVFDTSDHKVKVYENNDWVDLSVDTTGIADTTLQDSLNENVNAKVAIGTATATPGILVLEDTDKAMILPKVADPHLNIISPAPGMIVYDTNKKLLAVFNGTVWTFWGE
ncbi:hypothetical protein [Chryseobacterium sp.]|uniref:hypothetical protein n=1 Tax=Chryseobacterium sp. TaxID=1871047 RepID=UPI0025BFA4B2|nr:hypothetical protein [Chryseobacterium sp.]